MKKLLIASTALVASAGFAAADIAISGSANMGVKYNSAAANTTTVANDVDVNFTGSGTTDGGLAFGASIGLDDRTGAGTVDVGNVFVSGAFGKLSIGGDVSEAARVGGIKDLGYDDVGVDDDLENLDNNPAHTVHYTVTFDAFTFAVSAAPNVVGINNWGTSIGWKSGDFSASLGYSELGSGKMVRANVGAVFAPVTVNVTVIDQNPAAGANVTGYGLDLAFALDSATTISLVANDTTAAGDEPDYGIGVDYSLGGGATLSGAIASIDNPATARRTVADFGIKLTF